MIATHYTDARQATVAMVTCVYNASSYLSEYIDQVSATPWLSEVIIVDDASTDSTWEMLEHFARTDRRVSILRNDQNLGPADSRNRGVASARSKYVWMVDVDDSWSPDAGLRLAETASSTGADLIIGRAEVRPPGARSGKDVRKTPWHGAGPSAPNEVRAWFLTGAIRGYTWDKLFSRHLFDAHGFVKSRTYNDFIGVFSASMSARRVQLVDEVVYFHIANQDSVSRNRDVSFEALYSCYQAVVDSYSGEISEADRRTLDYFFAWFFVIPFAHGLDEPLSRERTNLLDLSIAAMRNVPVSQILSWPRRTAICALGLRTLGRRYLPTVRRSRAALNAIRSVGPK